MPGTRLTELTLAEVKKLQQPSPNGFIYAAGRYQGIPRTLAGFTNNGNENAKFDKATQDAFAISLIRNKSALGTYVYGETYRASEDEHLTLACLGGAQIWASLPVRAVTTRTDKNQDGSTKRVVTINPGQAYYGGVGVNSSNAKITLTEYESVLRSCRAAKNPQALLNLIGRAEVGTDVDVGYDVVNAENGRVIPLPGSVNYINRISGVSKEGSTRKDRNGVDIQMPGNLRGSVTEGGPAIAAGTAGPGGSPTQVPPTPPSRETLSTGYIQTTYLDPLQRNAIPYTIWKNLKFDQSTSYEQFLRNGAVLTSDKDLEGEIFLLTGISSQASELTSQVNTIMGRLIGFSPAEQYLLISQRLFEFFPDDMRNRMAANAGSGLGAVTTPHAWRAPGKVAVTANITIPGASGFRIGEVFWIGRTYENFKNFGVFQLFGLTETIDTSRGWTTQLYSRFNAIPKTIMLNKKSI